VFSVFFAVGSFFALGESGNILMENNPIFASKNSVSL
jgi:hypothetical protein